MTGSGAPEIRVEAADVKVAIVAASWHWQVTDALVAGALSASERAGAAATVFRVPGAFELPVAALKAARAGFDAVVALGAVIRGGTPHFEYVCDATTMGLMEVSVRTGVPIGFGVLTCDDEAQALDRVGLPASSEDKGAEAFDAALATVTALREMPSAGRLSSTGSQS